MSQDKRTGPFGRKRWAAFGGDGSVGGDAPLDGVSAQASSRAGGEQWVLGSSRQLARPFPKHCDGWTGEGHRAFLAALSLTFDVGAGAHVQVTAAVFVTSSTVVPRTVE